MINRAAECGHLEYFYFRVYRWLESSSRGLSYLHLDAMFLLSLLLALPILLIVTILRAVFDIRVLLTDSKMTSILLLILTMTIVVCITYGLVVRDGRWRSILNAFSKIDPTTNAKLNRTFVLFVAASITSLIASFAVAIYVGLGSK